MKNLIEKIEASGLVEGSGMQDMTKSISVHLSGIKSVIETLGGMIKHRLSGSGSVRDGSGEKSLSDSQKRDVEELESSLRDFGMLIQKLDGEVRDIKKMAKSIDSFINYN